MTNLLKIRPLIAIMMIVIATSFTGCFDGKNSSEKRFSVVISKEDSGNMAKAIRYRAAKQNEDNADAIAEIEIDDNKIEAEAEKNGNFEIEVKFPDGPEIEAICEGDEIIISGLQDTPHNRRVLSEVLKVIQDKMEASLSEKANDGLDAGISFAKETGQSIGKGIYHFFGGEETEEEKVEREAEEKKEQERKEKEKPEPKKFGFENK